MSTLKEIPGLGEFYLASPDGRIYSVRRNRWLTPASDTHGYQVVTISIGGKCKTMKVHRLLAMAFIPNPNNYSQTNHINGIKNDNLLSNLEWCNASMNQIHARSMGLSVTTEKMRAASSNNIKNYGRTKRKLSFEQASEIKNSTLSCMKAGILYGVSSSLIHQIRKGKGYAKP